MYSIVFKAVMYHDCNSFYVILQIHDAGLTACSYMPLLDLVKFLPYIHIKFIKYSVEYFPIIHALAFEVVSSVVSLYLSLHQLCSCECSSVSYCHAG